MTQRLALMTFGILREPYGSPVVQGFVDAVAHVYAAAEKAPGYIAHSAKTFPTRSKFHQVFTPFGGELAMPRFYDGGTMPGTVTSAETLSLWTGLKAAERFVYDGLHKEVLGKRLQWLMRPRWPTYVLWWVGADHLPTWREGCERLEHLHDHGPSPKGFTFRAPVEPAAATWAPASSALG